ncbi:MAG: cbb3-type cytochrome c oxidase subunit I [Elusimicrobia bacterium]|nr:cbb3-type cytochrome c oxidase subunit I [Elusimicrobiota bacterium]
MDAFARYFVVMALIYLGVGTFLGWIMTLPFADSGALIYRMIPTHVHLNLLGWISMMIYGVLYHILPRFSGKELYSKKLAWLHFYLAQISLLGLALFFFLNRLEPGRWKEALFFFGSIQWLSILLFIFNMLKTLFVSRV